MDLEPHRLQTVHRGTVTTRSKDQEVAPLLVVPLIQEDVPEPLDHWRIGSEATIARCYLQFTEIKASIAYDCLLELTLVEKCGEHVNIYPTFEAFHESVELSGALSLELILYEEFDKLGSVFFGHGCLRTILDQLNLESHPLRHRLCHKVTVNYVF